MTQVHLLVLDKESPVVHSGFFVCRICDTCSVKMDDTKTLRTSVKGDSYLLIIAEEPLDDTSREFWLKSYTDHNGGFWYCPDHTHQEIKWHALMHQGLQIERVLGKINDDDKEESYAL